MVGLLNLIELRIYQKRNQLLKTNYRVGLCVGDVVPIFSGTTKLFRNKMDAVKQGDMVIKEVQNEVFNKIGRSQKAVKKTILLVGSWCSGGYYRTDISRRLNT